MYEYEVILVEKTYGQVKVRADGPDEAKRLALESSEIDWNAARDAEVAFVLIEGGPDKIVW